MWSHQEQWIAGPAYHYLGLTNMNDITKSVSTKIQYENTHQRNHARCADSMKVEPSQVTDIMYTRWLCGLKFELATRSWRVYKAASLHSLTEKQDRYRQANNGEYDEELHFAIMELSAESQTGTRKNTQRTSALKQKFVKEDKLDELLIYFEDVKPTTWNLRAAKAIRATIRTGVRPCEWSAAQVNNDYLVVQNAKATNGRGNGVERMIPYSSDAWHEWLMLRIDSKQYSDEDRSRFYLAREKAPSKLWESCIVEVESHLLEITKWRQNNPDAPFITYQQGISQVIKRACKAMWPKEKKIVTLYSLRHQFIANMKNVLPSIGITELVGHHSLETAQLHYAKSSQGHSDFKETGKDIRSAIKDVQHENHGE
jgi:integrase